MAEIDEELVGAGNSSITNFHTGPNWDLSWEYNLVYSGGKTYLKCKINRIWKSGTVFEYSQTYIPGFVKGSSVYIYDTTSSTYKEVTAYFKKYKSHNVSASNWSEYNSYNFYPDGSGYGGNHYESHTWNYGYDSISGATNRSMIPVMTDATKICIISACQGCNSVYHNTMQGSAYDGDATYEGSALIVDNTCDDDHKNQLFEVFQNFYCSVNKAVEIGSLLTSISFKPNILYNIQPRYNYTGLGNFLNYNTNPSTASTLYTVSNRGTNRTITLNHNILTTNLGDSYLNSSSNITWSVSNSSFSDDKGTASTTNSTSSSATLTLTGTGRVTLTASYSGLTCSMTIYIRQPIEFVSLQPNGSNDSNNIYKSGDSIYIDILNTSGIYTPSSVTYDSALFTISGAMASNTAKITLRDNSTTRLVENITVTAVDGAFNNNSKTATANIAIVSDPSLIFAVPSTVPDIISKYDQTITVNYIYDNNRPSNDTSNKISYSNKLYFKSSYDSNYTELTNVGSQLTYTPSNHGISHSNTEYSIYMYLTSVATYMNHTVNLQSTEIDKSGMKTYSIPKNQYCIFHSYPVLLSLYSDEDYSASENIVDDMFKSSFGSNNISSNRYEKFMNVKINGNRAIRFAFYNSNTNLTEIWNTANTGLESRKYVIELLKENGDTIIRTDKFDEFIIESMSSYSGNIVQYSFDLSTLNPDIFEPVDQNGVTSGFDTPLYIKFYIETYDADGNIVYTKSDYESMSNTINDYSIFSSKKLSSNNPQTLCVRYTPLDPVMSIDKVGVYPYDVDFNISWRHNHNIVDKQILDANDNIIGYEDRGFTTDYHFSLYIDNDYVYSHRYMCEISDTSVSTNKMYNATRFFKISNGVLPMRWYSITITPCCSFNSNSHRLGPDFSIDDFIYMFSRLGKPRIIYPISGYWLNPVDNAYEGSTRFAVEMPEDPDYQYLTSEQKSNYKYSNLKLNYKFISTNRVSPSDISDYTSYNVSNERDGDNPTFYSTPDSNYSSSTNRINFHTGIDGHNILTFFRSLLPSTYPKYFIIFSVSVEKDLPTDLPYSSTTIYNRWSEDSDYKSLHYFMNNYPISDSLANFVNSPLSYDMTQDKHIKTEEITSINNIAARVYGTYMIYNKDANMRPLDYGYMENGSMRYYDSHIMQSDVVYRDLSYYRDRIIYLSDLILIYNRLIDMTDNYNNMYKDLYGSDLPTSIRFPDFYNENIENEYKSIITAEQQSDSKLVVLSDETKGYNYIMYMITAIRSLIRNII